jgi:hypothetical protein
MFTKEWYIANDFRLSDMKTFGIKQMTTSSKQIKETEEREFRTSLQSLVLLLHALDIERGIYFRVMMEKDDVVVMTKSKQKTTLSVTEMREQIFPLIRNMKPDLLKQLYLQYL